MTPLCNITDCNDDATLDSITGQGMLCTKHVMIEADEVASR